MFPRRFVAALVAVAAWASAAQAGVVGFKYQAESPTYTGEIGSTKTVNLYLYEYIDDSSTIIGAGGAQQGVASVVVGVNRTAGDAVIASATGNTAQFSNSSLNAVEVVNSGVNAGISLFAPNGGAVVAANESLNVNKVFIGSLNITVGSASTTYTIVNGELAASNTTAFIHGKGTRTFPSNLVLDAASGMAGSIAFQGTTAFPTATFVVEPSAIPEPSGLALAGLFAAGVVIRRRRQRPERLQPTAP